MNQKTSLSICWATQDHAMELEEKQWIVLFSFWLHVALCDTWALFWQLGPLCAGSCLSRCHYSLHKDRSFAMTEYASVCVCVCLYCVHVYTIVKTSKKGLGLMAGLQTPVNRRGMRNFIMLLSLFHLGPEMLGWRLYLILTVCFYRTTVSGCSW